MKSNTKTISSMEEGIKTVDLNLEVPSLQLANKQRLFSSNQKAEASWEYGAFTKMFENIVSKQADSNDILEKNQKDLEGKLLQDLYKQSLKKGSKNELLKDVRQKLKFLNKKDLGRVKKITKKRWWTPEEDTKLKTLVEKYGVSS